jgi:shikimate dehydrogenase
MHNAAFRALGLDWAYVAFEVPPGAAHATAAVAGMRALGLVGLNVTMPHKADVAAAVDRLTPTAEALGAVNTVAWGPGPDVLTGHNTDGPGLLDALLIDEGFDPSGRRCVVFGAGGAGRAVIRALGEAGAASVTVVNRTVERALAAAPLAGAAGRIGVAADVADADLVVNATPAGMNGVEGVAIDPALLGTGQLVIDLVYYPAVTPLVEAARMRGAVAINGLGMLIHQAAHAIRLWTGEDPPLEVMSSAALGELARRG